MAPASRIRFNKISINPQARSLALIRNSTSGLVSKAGLTVFTSLVYHSDYESPDWWDYGVPPKLRGW